MDNMDNMDKYEKVFEALLTLKEFCKTRDKCRDCPLRVPFTQERCYLKNKTPDNWNLNKPDDWRAFNV